MYSILGVCRVVTPLAVGAVYINTAGNIEAQNDIFEISDVILTYVDTVNKKVSLLNCDAGIIFCVFQYYRKLTVIIIIIIVVMTIA
jgi:hypothetical protein